MMPEVQASTIMMLTMVVLLDGNDDAADVERKMQLRPASSGVADVDSRTWLLVNLMKSFVSGRPSPDDVGRTVGYTGV